MKTVAHKGCDYRMLFTFLYAWELWSYPFERCDSGPIFINIGILILFFQTLEFWNSVEFLSYPYKHWSSSSLIMTVGALGFHVVWPMLSGLCNPFDTSQLFHPALFRSFSTVLLQVVFGLPLALRPSGVHLNTVKESFSPFLLSMWPSQFHLFRRTLQLMSLISAKSSTLLFVILCCHVTQ